MLTFIALILIVALIAAFIILFMGKTGFRDYVVERGPKLLSRMFDCDFCLSFWTCAAVCALQFFLIWDPIVLLFPPLATPIIRKLI